MNSWIPGNVGLVVMIVLYLVAYMVMKYFVKSYLISRLKKKP